jgi:hypothetical protein
MRQIVILIPILFTLSTSAFCQRENNNIEDRINIRLNERIESSTESSDVQWSCINKNLTHKCLIYHNDQWFSFRPRNSGPYYITLSDQQCRNKLGIQLVVLEGNPCETQSYRLKRCIGYSDQSDFSVMIDSLDITKEYLFNIDGYLGDICTFTLEMLENPRGLPLTPENLGSDFNAQIQQADSLVSIQWLIPDSLITDLEEVAVYRKSDKTSASKKLLVPVTRNAAGVFPSNYVAYDTLPRKGSYTYTIFLKRHRRFYAFDSKRILYEETPKVNHLPSKIHALQYYLPHADHVRIIVLDKRKHEILRITKRSVTGVNIVYLDLSPMAKAGHKEIIITLKGKYIDEGRKISIPELKAR